MIPIFKKGTKTAPGNYRPVSLTCISCKIMESIVKDDIMSHLSRNKLVRTAWRYKERIHHHKPSGVLGQTVGGHSKGIATDVIYLDFAKTFDKLTTERPLKKVSEHGICGKVGR